MARRFTSHTSWIAVGALVLTAAFVLTSCASNAGQAKGLPGTVGQTGSASASGLVVEIERATFSGTAVEVEITVRSENPGVIIGGVLPSDAELGGVAGQSVNVGRDGGSILRFPASAWPEKGDATQLTIRAVQVRRSEGRFEPAFGEWRLLVKLPQGRDAETARSVEALEPVVAEVAGHEVAVRAFRTHSATVVRYQLPSQILAFAAPPTLRANGTVVQLRQAEQQESGSELWFAPTPADASLVLVFDGLKAPDPEDKPWTLNFTLAAFKAPARAEVGRQFAVTWEQRAPLDGPAILDVAWERRAVDASLNITVAGLWDPAAGGAPSVTGDGEQLDVYGIGLRPETSDRAAQTIISVKLRNSKPPGDVVVAAAGATIAVAPVEVVLKP
jgi:hypothetical protein